ncbi:MAG: hypothetical protein K0R50_1288 [Eubacterium sp.]|jgi:hypothetical protein|nr:hypothetical protein [Eubacterium sp.]
MKKLYLSILYVVAISVFISGTILFSKPQAKYSSRSHNSGAERVATNRQSNLVQKQNTVEGKGSSQTQSHNLKQEDINIFNNKSKVNLHASLAEDSNGLITLNLAYNLNGTLVTKSIDASHINEIRNIFKFRDKYRSGYTVKYMLLNEKFNRIYFCVEGRKENRYSRTTMYFYNMVNSRIEKVFYDEGEFNNFSISPDGRYNAITYSACPQNLSINEKTVLIILDCENNKLIFNSNNNIKQSEPALINDLYIYSHSFVKWYDNNTCELRQRIRAKDGLQKDMEKTLFYNIASKKVSR